MHKTELRLPYDYAMVLQQIQEDGEDDFETLAETLQVDRPRLAHIIDALYHKGLIRMSRESSRQAWISVSSKGQRLLTYMWPESRPHPA